MIWKFFQTGLVTRLPTAVLAMGIMLVAILSFTTGLILDTVTRGRREAKMLAYLQYNIYHSPTDDEEHQTARTDENTPCQDQRK